MPDRLSPLDASFLSLERGELPMHVGALLVFQGPAPSYEEFAAAIAQRLDLLPRYRQRVREVPLQINAPVWVDDPHFQLDYHLRHIALPPPGGEVQLQTLTGHLLSQRLDLSRPLWEMWLIVGLEGDRWAILNKTHQALLDGRSGGDLISVLLDDAADAAERQPDRWQPQPEPGGAELMGSAVTDRMRQPLRTVEEVGAGALHAPREFATRTAAQLLGALRTGERLLHNEDFLVGPVGPHRRWTWVEMDLDTLRAIKETLGTTTTDVLLAAVAGGFRALLLERGEDLSPSSSVRTLVPVSVQAAEPEATMVSAVLADLPVGEPDPRHCLARISRQMADLKASPEALSVPALLDAAPFVSPALLAAAGRLAARLPQHSVGTITTNVPGPQRPLYLMGRPMTGLIPFVPLGPRVRAAIAFMSYNGGVWAGITADYDTVPDVEQIGEGISATIADLDLAAGG